MGRPTLDACQMCPVFGNTAIGIRGPSLPMPTGMLIADLSSSAKGEWRWHIQWIGQRPESWLSSLSSLAAVAREHRPSSWILDLFMDIAFHTHPVKADSETSDGRTSLVRCPTILQDYNISLGSSRHATMLLTCATCSQAAYK